MGASNQKTLVNLLEKEYEEGANADVEIQCEKKRFKASRFLLCLQSPVIKAMLDSTHSRRACIKLDTSNSEAVEVFLRFIYTGRLKGMDGLYLDVLRLADQLCVEHLKDTCLRHLAQTLSMSTLFDSIRFAYQHKLNDLKPLIMDFVAEHLHLVTPNSKWKELDALVRLDIMEGAMLVQQASTSGQSGDISLRIDPPIGHVENPNQPLIHYLHNPSSHRLAFRILYSSSMVFCPRPATGFIESGCSVRLEVRAVDERLLPYMLSVLFTEATQDETNAWVLFNRRPRCKCVDLIINK